MSTEELRKNTDDGDEIEVLLKGLKKVNAPGDFDTRLRSRIVNYSAANDRSFNFGFMRFAAPAVIVVFAALAGYFVLLDPGTGDSSAGREVSAQQMPEVEDTMPSRELAAATPGVAEKTDAAIAVSAVNSAVQPDTRISSAANNRRPERVATGGGSEDRAATAPDATIFPPGIRPDQPVNGIPASPQGGAEISVPDVLDLLGVRAVYGEGGWRVVAAESTGAAGMSGVRVGDIIISLGTTVLGERTVLRAPANFNSLRVRRAGAVIELKLGR